MLIVYAQEKEIAFLLLLFRILGNLVIWSDLHQIFAVGSRFYLRGYSGEVSMHSSLLKNGLDERK